jgi:hypothetical protein
MQEAGIVNESRGLHQPVWMKSRVTTKEIEFDTRLFVRGISLQSLDHGTPRERRHRGALLRVLMRWGGQPIVQALVQGHGFRICGIENGTCPWWVVW